MITDKLELAENMRFDRVHRFNAKPKSPIVERCTFYKDKESNVKENRKLNGSDVFIGDDFSSTVREVRRKLFTHLKAEKNQKRAAMVFDHLLIEGRTFVLGKENKLEEVALKCGRPDVDKNVSNCLGNLL